VCACCGQTWPCTEIAWADNIPLAAATLRRRKIRAVLVVAGLVASPVVVTLLSAWLAKG
jgi:hypothetical protein